MVVEIVILQLLALLIPAIGTGIALGNINTPYLFFASMALFQVSVAETFASSIVISASFSKENTKGIL